MAFRKCEKMNDDEWEDFKMDIEDYLDTGEVNKSIVEICKLNLKIGSDSPKERVAAKGALKALLTGRDGTPFRKGQKPSIKAPVRVVIDQVVAAVEQSSIDYFNSHKVIKEITMKQNKSGGGQYENAEEYAKAEGRRARNRLSKWYKTEKWDGTRETIGL